MNILSHTKTDESMVKEKETVDESVPNNIENSMQKVIKIYDLNTFQHFYRFYDK